MEIQFEEIATGFCFLEAPREVDGAVWFTDVVLSGVRRLLPDGRVEEYLPGRKWIGGMVPNQDGSVLCSGGDGIAWINPENGKTGMLLDQLGGKPIRGINELQPDPRRGGVYFGTADVTEADHDEERSPSELYRLDPDGSVTLLADGFVFANGIALSPDGRRLYVSDTTVGPYAFDIRPDGSLGERVLLAEMPDCDGLEVDAEGGVWVAGFQSGALVRVSPEGGVDARIAVPAQGVTSLCFGGPDQRDVYVATTAHDTFQALGSGGTPSKTGSLYKGRSGIPGHPAGVARFELDGAR